METIFENIMDWPAFQDAIKESLPDKGSYKKIEEAIGALDKKEKDIQKDLNKLVDSVLDGTLAKETIQDREQKLRTALEATRFKLSGLIKQKINMPDPKKALEEAEQIHLELKRKYSGQERLEKMTFKEKRKLLHYLFDGKAPNGDPYGIYINRRGKYNSIEVDYFLFGRIVGLRTMKGDNIDYFENSYRTKNVTIQQHFVMIAIIMALFVLI